MGAGTTKSLKRRTFLDWWNDFCASVSAAWNSIKVKAHIVELPLVTMDELNEPRENSTNTSIVHSESDDDSKAAVHPLVRQNTYSVVTQSTSESTLTSGTLVSVNNELHHSPATVAAVQQSERDAMPAHMYKVGLILLALSGFLSMAASFSGILPIFGLSGLLAVLGGALILTAYLVNDEEKNGTLTSQAFPADPQKPVVPASGLVYGR